MSHFKMPILQKEKSKRGLVVDGDDHDDGSE